MKILVLDTIHGGEEIAGHFRSLGYATDTVDVYRGKGSISSEEALNRSYDLIISPVHLDPDHPLLNYSKAPVVSHHEAVRMLLLEMGKKPSLMIEVTGARGKTTTSYALACVLGGIGVLHTSKGTFEIPEMNLIFKKSITPASVIDAAIYAHDNKRWLVAEESLGVSGLGDIGILTSNEDYPCALGKKSAIEEKMKLLKSCKSRIFSPGAGIKTFETDSIYSSDIAKVIGDECRYSFKGFEGSFKNPLLLMTGYVQALITAAALACTIGISPKRLESFRPLEGRLSYSSEDGVVVVDNSNSGVNVMTSVEAARFAREISGSDIITLVIGIEAANICEGFPAGMVSDAIKRIKPHIVVIVGDTLKDFVSEIAGDIRSYYADNLTEGKKTAIKAAAGFGSVVLCVKTWR
ncbi:coenzyme F430 synthase [Methanoplanus sp. FWC-SCC4]|uniref:Coenzyme F430 synthase n=1 Tax=Methanochimaera problematica TaxID=2609417 RepID=A0AA97FD24_9EURY|nr:coenzyme F430 synthase [Methanoplanus sp. FWC-SCC4]WOF16307.1 coenzyme F430 synthase [Methanoplanus sp. FWC-SCC4]